MVSPEGSARARSTSKLTHMVAERPRFFLGCWTGGSSSPCWQLAGGRSKFLTTEQLIAHSMAGDYCRANDPRKRASGRGSTKDGSCGLFITKPWA